MIKHVLTCYADKLEEEEKQDSGGLYKLSEDKVCRYYAELLLRVSGKVRKGSGLEINPFTLRVIVESIVCYSHTFENNLRSKRKFIKI